MAFSSRLYPRTIAVRRPNLQTSTTNVAGTGRPSQLGGDGRYWAATRTTQTDASAAGEQVVQSGIACSIQATGGKSSSLGEVPADAPGPSRWLIFIPLGIVAKGTIKRNDVIVDDEGQRYLVSSPYWDSLGWKVEAIALTN